MNNNSYLPLEQRPIPFDPESSAKDIIDMLCDICKARQDPELIAMINEAKGLYAGYDAIGNPELAEAVMAKLGHIINYLLGKNSFDPFSALLDRNRTDLLYFMQGQREQLAKADHRIRSLDAFVEQFDRYLELQGKKEQTRAIYKGKVKAFFKLYDIDLPVSAAELRSLLNSLLRQGDANINKDHNLKSTVNNLSVYINGLLED